MDNYNNSRPTRITVMDGSIFSQEDMESIKKAMTVPCEVASSSVPATALKYDAGKPRMELLSNEALCAIARVLAYGAQKYTKDGEGGEHNWRKGFDWSRLYGAAMRHVMAHMDGEDKDPESGLSHLAHAGCCIMFLLEMEVKQFGRDDRYKRNIKG